MEGPSEAQWAPDPYRRHELRYWDGAQWTEHVSEGDGSVLVDPPLPAPRAGREMPGTAAAAADRSAVHVGRASSGGPVVAAAAAAPSSSPVPSLDLRPEPMPAMSPVVLPDAAAPAGYPASRSGGSRPPDLFQNLPGSRRPARAGAPGVVGGALPAASVAPGSRDDGSADLGFAADAISETADDEDDGWDWRESHVPEFFSGLAVAGLIALAAMLGAGGGPAGSAEGVRSIVSTAPGAATGDASTKPAKKKSTKKRTVPGVQISSAKVPRTTHRPRTSATPRATTTTRTRTRPPTPTPTATTPPDSMTPTATQPPQPTETPTADKTPTETATTKKN